MPKPKKVKYDKVITETDKSGKYNIYIYFGNIVALEKIK
jgi:hypothetical protein